MGPRWGTAHCLPPACPWRWGRCPECSSAGSPGMALSTRSGALIPPVTPVSPAASIPQADSLPRTWPPPRAPPMAAGPAPHAPGEGTAASSLPQASQMLSHPLRPPAGGSRAPLSKAAGLRPALSASLTARDMQLQSQALSRRGQRGCENVPCRRVQEPGPWLPWLRAPQSRVMNDADA